jgi:hypothetical protein
MLAIAMLSGSLYAMLAGKLRRSLARRARVCPALRARSSLEEDSGSRSPGGVDREFSGD